MLWTTKETTKLTETGNTRPHSINLPTTKPTNLRQEEGSTHNQCREFVVFFFHVLSYHMPLQTWITHSNLRRQIRHTKKATIIKPVTKPPSSKGITLGKWSIKQWTRSTTHIVEHRANTPDFHQFHHSMKSENRLCPLVMETHTRKHTIYHIPSSHHTETLGIWQQLKWNNFPIKNKETKKTNITV